MSQFEGTKNKQVRCTDCVKLSGSRCTAKNVKVSPKKKRHCTVYQFTGQYANKTPAESVYIPQTDKKTKKLLRSLLDMGVVPVGEDGNPLPMADRAGFTHRKNIPMPLSTATATQVEMRDASDSLLIQPDDVEKEDRLVWVPEDG